MAQALSRRDWLLGTSALAGTGGLLNPPPVAAAFPRPAAFHYCLNTSTIQGQKLDLVEVVEIAAKAGYQAIEPWIPELDQFVKKGGSLKTLGQRLHDRGLTVESAIGFSEWLVDDEPRRKKGLEDARRSMDLVQQLGGKRLAAPPAGATNHADLDLRRAAERYRALLELGEQFGVVPEVELWGSSRCLSRLGDVAYVALESGHPKACILLDVFHLYKGGSTFSSMRLLAGHALPVIHFNDYPADPPRTSINDAARIFPGDGVAPLTSILRDLRDIGFQGFLSLELFNRDYWKKDALTVARTGLEKMKTLVASVS